MQIKTEVSAVLKLKQNHIAWGLIVPVVLAMVQLVCFAVSAPPTTRAVSEADVEQSAVRGTPEVLGASTDIRGQELGVSKPKAPAVPEESLTKISSASFLVYDQGSGTVLLERNPNQKAAIASLTKLMTGLLAYDNLDLGQTVKVDTRGLTNIHPIVGFEKGDEVALSNVFDAMIVGSCNDAAQVLGREVAAKTGKSITELMNAKALELGMTDTKFANPIGFDSSENYSTVADMRKLIEATQKFAVFTNLGRTTSLAFSGVSGASYRIIATNTLLKEHADIQAVKTGFTKAAQGAMAAKISRDGHQIVILVLGSQNREQDTLELKRLVADRTEWQ